MPIHPENKSRYPKDWKQIRARILERAVNCCEFCGVPNYSIRPNGTKVVLTIAHLDHTPENCDQDNLRALKYNCRSKEYRFEELPNNAVRKQPRKYYYKTKSK